MLVEVYEPSQAVDSPVALWHIERYPAKRAACPVVSIASSTF